MARSNWEVTITSLYPELVTELVVHIHTNDDISLLCCDAEDSYVDTNVSEKLTVFNFRPDFFETLLST
jgi:hypothetical protein